MKKLMLLFLIGALTQQLAFADREFITTNERQLPQNARDFLKKTFPKTKVYLVKIERESNNNVSYDVTLRNGYNVEFDRFGDWTEIDFRKEPIPELIIPNAILMYVNESTPNQKITKIEKDERRYKVKLTNEDELVFGPDYTFIRIDD
jgi:hypothetical protein